MMAARRANRRRLRRAEAAEGTAAESEPNAGARASMLVDAGVGQRHRGSGCKPAGWTDGNPEPQAR